MVHIKKILKKKKKAKSVTDFFLKIPLPPDQNPVISLLLSNLPVHVRLPVFVTGLRLRQGKAVELPDLQTQAIHEMLIKLEAMKGRGE